MKTEIKYEEAIWHPHIEEFHSVIDEFVESGYEIYKMFQVPFGGAERYRIIFKMEVIIKEEPIKRTHIPIDITLI